MSNRLLFSEPLRSLPETVRRARRATMWDAVRAAWRRHRSRQRISELDRHMLKDIGITFAEAEAEANKPFWRL